MYREELDAELRRLALGLLVAVVLGTGAPRDAAAVLTWGDQGDGTYRNPVLKADYSDPDVIRVGERLLLVAGFTTSACRSCTRATS